MAWGARVVELSNLGNEGETPHDKGHERNSKESAAFPAEREEDVVLRVRTRRSVHVELGAGALDRGRKGREREGGLSARVRERGRASGRGRRV